MKTGIDSEDHRLYREKVEAKKDDYVDLYADMDLMVAISACPIGSGVLPPDPKTLKIEIYFYSP